MKCCLVLFAIFGAALSADTACLRACPMNYAPVCASNGVTYSNKCAMEAAACGFQVVLTVMSDGACPQTTTAAAKQVDTSCLRICPFIYMPVCGSDGKTYSNTCEMEAKACQLKTTLSVATKGECPSPVV